MGLDQFLWKVKKEKVGYFRKVNCLAGFIAKNYNFDSVDGIVELNQNEILNIIETAYKILEAKETPEFEKKAKSLMPTKQGFFFGCYEYNDFYIDDLNNIIEVFKEILENTNFENETILYENWY